jgi:hypothetical protein
MAIFDQQAAELGERQAKALYPPFRSQAESGALALSVTGPRSPPLSVRDRRGLVAAMLPARDATLASWLMPV